MSLEINAVQGYDGRRRPTDLRHKELKLSKKVLKVNKGERTILEFPFDFPVGSVGKTEFRNLKTPIGEINGFMFQIINDVASEQLSIKVHKDCLVDGNLVVDKNNYFIFIKDEFEIAFVEESNSIISRL